MKRLLAASAMMLILLSLATPAFSQGGFFASVTGTVTDTSKALIPGVTVKATGADTGVVTTTVTNEAGSYTFNNLNPGKYTISASLPGFQTKNVTDALLSQNTSYRFNFELTVSGVNTQVEVSISADTILSTSGASIGTVLNEQKIRDLPLVGNNVLNLITVLAGIENIAPDNSLNRESTTFAGVSAQNVSIVRDGIQVQNNRYPNGISSVTTISPDLVGEIRLILTPVDVEIGRGNGTIQYSTRSGTNRLSGSALWSFRNTALDPNTWLNNRNQTVPTGSPAGTVPVATRPTWTNSHQGTISVGGPIIRNKTFFFGLFDIYANRSRALTTVTVPTPCARLGIFRYFNGWGNGNLFTQKNETSATNAAYPSVRPDGTPVNPMNNGATTAGGLPPGWNTAIPYDASLQYISVFGALQSKPTAADCSDAAINKTTLVPNGVSITGSTLAANGSNGWDLYRKQMDPTGFMAKQLAISPAPNNFESGDGLNTAGYRILNHFRGLDNLFGVGEGTGDRTQYNVKVDHNFSSNHKANVNVTYERVSSDDIKGVLPGMVSNANFRRPAVVSVGFTSTLSSTMLNEARFGMRRQGTNVVAPWDRKDSEVDATLKALLPAPVNGFLVIPNMAGFGFCIPYFGGRPPGGCGGVTDTAIDRTPTDTYVDTLSWTRGAHALKFGGELRTNSSETKQTATGFFGTPMYARPTGGAITGTSNLGNTGPTDIAAANPAMPYLLGSATAGNSFNARTLANYLAGSLANVQHLYIVTSPDQIDFNDPSKNTWSDFRTREFTGTKIVQREFDAFVKDDFKVSKNWTINMGLRWDYFGVPYLESGLTNRVIGGLAGAFGVSGSSFDDWMRPGIRADVSKFEFVGKNSPNPGETLYPNDYNNFSPGVGFSWQVPWFGESQTTVRGGYQVTYQGGGRYNTLQPFLAGAPGNSLAQLSNWTNVYKDLTNVDATSLPITPSVLPLQPVPSNIRTATYTPFDDHYVAPYVQNLNLSVTRTMNKYVTMDVRYVGTLSRKQYSTTNLNTNNFMYNGLLDELNRVRTGNELTKSATDSKSLLDRMFDGVNLCAGAAACAALPAGQSFGLVGTTTGTGANAVYQSAALQLRSNTQFQANLANGSYSAIAGALSNFNYVVGTTTATNASLPAVPGGTVGALLRYANTKYPGQFPDNFVVANPQFAAVNLQNNNGYSNYHSLQVQSSIRPIHGMSGQFTYSWSKNLGLGAITDPTNRAADYTNINNNPSHSFRTNGTIELPIGPNKLFMGNSSGLIARALERWQLGLIYNLSSGAPTSITATTMLYGNGVPDIVYPVDFNKLKGSRWGTQNAAFIEGRYYDNNDMFVKVDDPQCSTVTTLQNLANFANGVQTRCTLDALAMAVPSGTAGATDRLFADGQTRPSVIVLQHAQPGKKGNLGNNTVIGLGSYRFDANLGKTFRVSESKSVQIKFDAQNVLNHPQPANPSLSITADGNYFGRMATKAGGRALQGQLRFSF